MPTFPEIWVYLVLYSQEYNGAGRHPVLNVNK